MQVGALLPQAGSTATRALMLRTARAAEAAGYDALWVNDHVAFPREYRSRYPYAPDGRLPARVTLEGSLLEPLTELAFVAAVTERIALGTAALVLPMRHPVLHAKVIATLDALAGGRCILGIGAGWAREEFALLGAGFDRRGARLEESLSLLRALWREDWVDGFRGEFWTVDGWTCRPRPARPIPIWIGGESEAALRRAGRLGDGWLAHGFRLPDLPAALEIVHSAAAEGGRDPAAITLAMTGITLLRADTLEASAQALQQAREAGVQHAILGIDPTQLADAPDLLERFSAGYLRELQGAPRSPPAP